MYSDGDMSIYVRKRMGKTSKVVYKQNQIDIRTSCCKLNYFCIRKKVSCYCVEDFT